jgi:hypothetical protein
MTGIDWDQNLFQPFVDFQVDYEMLEHRLLDDNLNEIISADCTWESNHARTLCERSVDVLSAAEERVGRCILFTQGYAAVRLLNASNDFFHSFIDIRSRL